MTSLLEAADVQIPGRLHPLHLRVEEGSLIAVIGPNGGGKTSLLRAIAGVEGTAGTIRIDGQRLTTASPAARSRLLSLLPATRDMVWPIATRDIMSLGLAAPVAEQLSRLIVQLELAPFLDRPISHLSTGERSRVLLARALAGQPRLLLLDEPLSNLDPYWVLSTLDIVRDAVRRERCAALMSLHDLTQLHRFDRILLMKDGMIVADGPPGNILDGAALAEAFRISRCGTGFEIRRTADPRSSP